MNSARSMLAVSMLALCLTIMAPNSAYPCGPGVHIRESDRMWEMIVDQYPGIGDLAETPLFKTYLHLGAIAPDIQWILPVHQGHSSEFSVFMIERALESEPRFRTMAMGHLLHNSSSDPLCEMFWTPTLMASAPLGMLNLLDGYDDAKGMSEGLTEVIGDPIVGDWDALIDMAYDIYFDGEEAQARGREAITWYITELNAFYGTDTDPDAIWQDILNKIAQVEGFVAGMDRQGAKDFFHSLKGETPTDMINFMTGDLIANLAGDIARHSEYFDVNIDTAMNSAVVDQAWWDIYQDTIIDDLSSYWFIDRLSQFLDSGDPTKLTETDLGWPGWSANAIISGNVMSTMQMLPDVYDVVPGLIVDQVQWLDDADTPIGGVTSELLTRQMKVRVKFYSAYDFDGSITLKVKGDLPGLDQSADPTLGTASAEFVLDPRTYVSGDRSTIEATFTPGAAMVDGFYFELYANDNPGPWLTSNWDTIFGSGTIPVDQPVYHDNFATYGKWPPSLPVTAWTPSNCTFFVTARTFPNGGPVQGATVDLAPAAGMDPGTEQWQETTAANGVAIFDMVQAGTRGYSITAPAGYEKVSFGQAEQISCNPLERRDVWIYREFHTIPRVWVPGGISGRNDCIAFNTNVAEFWHKADRYQISVINADDNTEILPLTEKNAKEKVEVCFPAAVENGTYVRINVAAKYKDDMGVGPIGVSEPVLIDSTKPVIESVDFSAAAETCAEGAAGLPFEVALYVSYENSAIMKLEWSPDGTAWTELVYDAVPGEQPYTARITVDFENGDMAPGDDMIFRITNAAGVSNETATEVPDSMACPTVGDPVVEVIDDIIENEDNGTGRDVSVGVDTNTGTDTATTDVGTDDGGNGSGGDGGGCSAGGAGGNGTSFMVVLLVMACALGFRRRWNA